MSKNIQEHQADDLFFQADHLIKDNKIGEAKELLLSIVREIPEYGRAYNHLGWLFENKYQDYVKSEYYYEQALKHAPTYLPMYYNFAVLLSNIKKFDACEELLNKALEVPGINLATIYNEFGIVNELRGNMVKAIECYQTSIKHLLDANAIELRLKSIERCRQKQNYFAGGYKKDA
ncbi:MAG: O-linked GlcNAc transferase [Cytophagales bacterium]|nr:MAG: O-linked GlcNAc transferase [Cytophagales bacterium]